MEQVSSQARVERNGGPGLQGWKIENLTQKKSKRKNAK